MKPKTTQIAHGSNIAQASGEGATANVNIIQSDGHRDWYTTIRPLQAEPIPDERYVQIRQEFYEGSDTRFEHITANLDFRRDAKLAEIAQAFQKCNVVIVHAPSGQGKTTLAYRYLHDYYPDQQRFSIERVQDLQHAGNIAATLDEHTSGIQGPLAVCVDVHPQDTAWPELVKQLARQAKLQILVAIREEDFRRTNIYGAGFAYEPVDLDFDEREARQIYERTIDLLQPTTFLNFEDAWDAFGGDGPLMEFVYLLTHTTSLRERLEGQVFELRREVERGSRPDKLRVLSLVAVASACEARIETAKLIEYLELVDPDHTLRSLEKEYLIRRYRDGHYVSGLHAVRSQILAELLTSPDITSWQTRAKQVLPLLVEDDLEIFLLQSTVQHPTDFRELLSPVESLQPETWRGAARILRSLLWAGMREYIESNRGVIEEARTLMGGAWYAVMKLNFTGDAALDVREIWESLKGLIPQEKLDQIKEVQCRQTPVEQVRSRATRWLGKLDRITQIPVSSADWASIAELLYWSGRCSQLRILGFLDPQTLASVADVTPLRICADLSLALFTANEAEHEQWLNRTRSVIEERLAREYGILYLDEQPELLKLHFITTSVDHEQKTDWQESAQRSDPLHTATIERLYLARKFFPTFAAYGAQGYGHKLGALPMPIDESEKPGVLRAYLPHESGPRLNGIAIGLGNYEYRVDTWDEYIQKLIQTRDSVLACMEQLRRGLERYLKSKRAIDIRNHYLDLVQWQTCFLHVNEAPELPKVAVDPWGLGSEGQSSLPDSDEIAASQKLIPRAIAQQLYQPFLEIQRDYLSSLRNFITQSTDVMDVNALTKKTLSEIDPLAASSILEKHGIRTDLAHLSTYNLRHALRVLPEFQKRFRRLFHQRTKLDTLEAKESRVLSHLWQLWYFFAHEPEQVIAKPFRSVPQKVLAAKQELERRIQRALQQVSTNGTSAAVMNTQVGWNGVTALWISLDVETPLNLYNAYQDLVTALQAALSSQKPQDLSYYLLNEYFEFTVIVPLVHGRLIADFAWPLYTASALVSDKSIEDAPLTFISQPLDAQTIDKLGLKRWVSPDIAAANQLSVSVATLMILASQVAEFHNLPDVSSHGEEALKAHLVERSSVLSNCVQGFLDAGTVLLEKYNALTEPEQAQREYLATAVARLVEIHRVVYPSEDTGGVLLSLNEVVNYAQVLTEMYQDAELVRLLWITDAIEQKSVNIS